MAKKLSGRVNNRIDADLDLGFEDMDFDVDPFKDDRKPVIKVRDGLISGAKSRVTDEAFIRGTLRELLPKGYGDTLDMGDKLKDTISKLYQEGANEVRPAIKDFKRVSSKLVPQDSKLVPERIKKLMKKWEEESKNASGPGGLDTAGQRDSMIALQLGEIFKEQSVQAAKKTGEEEAKSRIQEALEINRHKDIFGLLNQSNISLSRISQYQTTINLQYQKKSLELQHRQLFALYDILGTVDKTHALQADALAKIAKNTALPDWQKIEIKELANQKLFNKFTDTAGMALRGMMPGIDDYLQMTARKLKDRVIGGLRQNIQSFRSAMTEAESAKEQMGGMGDMVDPYQMGGDFAGSEATGLAGKWLAKKVKGPIAKAFPKLQQQGAYLENFNENIVEKLEKFKKNKKWDTEEGVKAWAMRNLQELLPNISIDTAFDKISHKDLQAVHPFTRRTDRSINEVIPGFLARILQEMQIIRTGNPNIDLVDYDQSKGKFVSSTALMKEISKNVFRPEDAKRTNSILDPVIAEIDPEGKLSAKERQALKQALFKNKAEFKSLDANLTGTAKELTSGYLSGMSSDYEKQMILNRRMTSLFKGAADPRAAIEKYIEQGKHQELIEMGIISVVNGEYKLNTDTMLKASLGDDPFKVMQADKRPKGSVRSKSMGKMSSVSSIIDSQGPSMDCCSHIEDLVIKMDTVINRLDTSIEHYQSIEDVLKTGLSFEMKRNSPKESFDREIDNMATKGKFRYNNFKTFVKKRKVRFKEQYDNATADGVAEGLKKAVSGATDKAGSLLSKGGQQLGILGNMGRDAFDKARSGVNQSGLKDKAAGAAQSIRSFFSDLLSGKEDIKGRFNRGLNTAEDYITSLFSRGKDKFNDVKDKVRDAWNEAYVTGDKEPRLTRAKFLAGKYVDAATGKVLDTLADIKGAVRDIDTNTFVLKLEEINNLYVKDITGKVVSYYDFTRNKIDPYLNRFKNSAIGSTMMQLTQDAWSSVKQAYKFTKSMLFGGAKDVWVSGEKAPRLTAVKMQQGKYFDSITGDPIYTPDDIKGEVKDDNGETKITLDDLPNLVVWDIEQKRFGPIRKLLRGLGKIYKLAEWYYKKIGIPLTKFNFRMIGKAMKLGVNLAKMAIGTGPMSVKDVYVGNEKEPRLFAVKINNGEYINKVDDTVIYHHTEIKGAVMDKSGKTVLSEEDLPNLRVYDSLLKMFNPLKLVGKIAKGLGKLAKYTVRKGLQASRFAFKMIGKVTAATVGKAIRYLSKPEDVFVKGNPEPLLTAVKMKNGDYYTAEGNPIDLPSDINGPVWDNVEKVYAITKDHILKGLVRFNGSPIKTNMIQGFLKGVKAVNKLFSRRVALNKAGMGAGKFSQIGKGEPDNESKTVSLLQDIKNIFDNKFGNKKVAGDADGDGDRDGSVQDIMAKRIEEKKNRKTTGAVGTKDKKEKGGIMGLLATALDTISGFLGGFTKLLKGGGVLGGLGKLLGLGGMATGAGGAIAGTLGAAGTAIAGVVSSPVVLGVLGAAVVGYGAYKGYKALRTWMSKPTTLETLRYVQYGFKKDDTSHFSKIVELEQYLMKHVKVGSEAAEIDDKKLDIKEIMSIFGFDSTINKDKARFGNWYIKRFKPVYLTHVSALNLISGGVDLTKVNTLKKDEKAKYLEAVKFPSGPYTFASLPIPNSKDTASNAADVAAAVEAAAKELATKPGDGKDAKTTEAQAKKAAESSADPKGKMDYGKAAGSSLPNGSVSGAAGVSGVKGAGAPNAFDIVRFKTYGLTELDTSKIVSLTMLEIHVSKKVTYQGTKATFDANPNEILEKLTPYFGISDLFGDRAVAWVKWFRDRFLPVYLNYCTLHMLNVNKPPKADGVTILDANQQYDVAMGLSATSGAWSVTDSPWLDYKLNTNPDTVKMNLQYLKDAAKEKTARDQAAKDAPKAPNVPKTGSPGNINSRGAGFKDPRMIGSGSDVVMPAAIPTPTDAQKSKEFSDSLTKGAEYFMPGKPVSNFTPAPSTVPQGSLLDFIGQKESNGNYNILVGGRTEPNLTNMTIAEVIEFQKGMRSRGHESTAVGKYQIIRKTLEGLVAAGYARMDEKFSPQTQDKLAVGLLKIRGLNKYLSGKMSPEQFADNLSKEWASLPYKTGASYYAGVGSNKAGGSRDAFVNIVKAGNIGMGGTMTAVYTPTESTSSSSGMMNTSYSEAPKSVYNPVTRPAAKQQQAVAASQEAQSAGSNPYSFTPSSVRTVDTATNANKNTLTGVSLENTEKILTQSLDVQTQTLHVMKMIHERISNMNPAGGMKTDGATSTSYEYPKAPVPMRKGMRA